MVNKNGSKIGEHVAVINENLVENRPMCIHGPTLLFEKTFDDGTEPIRFYGCSAFRSRNECPILKQEQIALHRAQLQAHSKSTVYGLAEIAKLSTKKRAYCHTCSCLFPTKLKRYHQNHDFLEGISDELLSQPTRFLRPLSDDTKEAQYFFADSTLQCIVNIFKQLGI
ncbi:rRNA N6-adenosine-methyltransferase ZCCHC4, partial [Pseudolycoriella hygida]